MVVELLFMAGDHVPVIPLIDVVGKAGMVAPWQYEGGMLNVGVTFGVMVISKEKLTAHCPAFGVKV